MLLRGPGRESCRRQGEYFGTAAHLPEHPQEPVIDRPKDTRHIADTSNHFFLLRVEDRNQETESRSG
jgi:hypothetical protein